MNAKTETSPAIVCSSGCIVPSSQPCNTPTAEWNCSVYFLGHLCMPLPYFLAHWHPVQSCPLAVSVTGPLIWTWNRRDEGSAPLMEGRRGQKLRGFCPFTAQTEYFNLCCSHTSKRAARQENGQAHIFIPLEQVFVRELPLVRRTKVLWDRAHLWRSNMRHHLLHGGTYLPAPIWWTL